MTMPTLLVLLSALESIYGNFMPVFEGRYQYHQLKLLESRRVVVSVSHVFRVVNNQHVIVASWAAFQVVGVRDILAASAV